MIQCAVCGQTYGVTHICPGAGARDAMLAALPLAPKGFAPVYYLRQSIGIARLDDSPIIAAARDRNAVYYGLGIWLIGQLLVFGSRLYPAVARARVINWFAVVFGVSILIVFDAALVLAQYGICHGLARSWFGARGTFVGVLRAMLLGSVVGWLVAIPYIGTILAGLWSVAVLMRVFEEVDRVERMQAFFLSLGTGLIFFVLTTILFAPGG